MESSESKLGLGGCVQGESRTLVFDTSYGMMALLPRGPTVAYNHRPKATESINQRLESSEPKFTFSLFNLIYLTYLLQ